jgi:hypothetical protein
MSLLEDSRVRTCPTQGAAPDCPEPIRDSTGNLYEPFAWYDRASRSWRMWQRSFLEGWEPFLETWPRSGMTRNGIAYRRAALVLLTGGTESGLLPTPEASNTKAIARRSAGRSPRNFLQPLPRAEEMWPTPMSGRADQVTGLLWGKPRLPMAVAIAEGQVTWPTPCATDADRGGRGRLPQAMREQWPTPLSRDYRTGDRPGSKRHSRQGQAGLNDVAAPGGQLNPTWVEWLMGFPLGWTDLRR